MTRTNAVLVLVCLLLAAPRGLGQEKYTIKLKEETKGDTFRATKSETTKGVTKVLDANGNALKDTPENKGHTYEYVATILERPADQKFPTALSRAYTKAEKITDGKKQTLDLEGKTVRIETKDGKYQFRFDGGAELSTEQAEELNREFNRSEFRMSDKDTLPKQAVALNEAWNVDPTLFVRSFGKEESQVFDASKAKFTGKLLKVYKKDNRQFGVIEYNVELPLKAGFDAGNGLKVQSGKGVMKVTTDTCIDGSSFAHTSKATMSFEMRGAVEANGMMFTVVVETNGTMDEVQADAGKK